MSDVVSILIVVGVVCVLLILIVCVFCLAGLIFCGLFSDSDQSLVDELGDALQSLYDVQNGSPLIKYEKDWDAAMDKSNKALTAYNKFKEQQDG